MTGPKRRPRRNRKDAVVRGMVRETHLCVDHLIRPLFVKVGKGLREPISSMPGQFRFSVDQLLKEVESSMALGLKAFALFPAIEEGKKDPLAKESKNPKGLYPTAIREIKKHFPETFLITDVAMDPYSSDGHDGIYNDGQILNDETLVVLGDMALVQAEAGSDCLGPSDMMDGRIGYLRNVLDAGAFQNVSLMSYTAKYASAFYGPFREALGSAPKHGDKKTYQMDPGNLREAILEAKLDVAEGADFLMVKPALPYLDVIRALNSNFSTPVVGYQVSGEYAMIMAASQNGWIDLRSAILESLMCIRRAGASSILTYFAADAAKLLRE
ncbi:MAG: porphobilinogen synthase [Bdellovibrionales bacterium]|nr:porphobilinogen synthase [Bdellovibrionales bacterium]